MLSRKLVSSSVATFRNGTFRQLSKTANVVPTIDVSALKNGTDAEKLKVAKEIGKACEEIGFFTIINHGIPKPVIDQCWNTTKSYFDLSVREKQIEMSADYPYGYSGYGEEDLSAGKAKELGEKDYQPSADMKESFSIGPYNAASKMLPQRWPAKPAHMQAHWHAYYTAMEGLSARLMAAFALALDLPANWFVDKTDRHCSAMRALNYPAITVTESNKAMRASAHTDYGALTILRQDQSGLQVMTRWGAWADVPVVPDAFIINLGDLMSRWTNNKWVSTMHQVIPPPIGTQSPRRQSIAYFHNINNDHVVRCIETCTSASNPPKHPSIVAMDFLMEKHLAATGGHKK